MSSPDELRRIAEQAQAEIAHHQHQRELGQLALERAAAEKAEKARNKRLDGFQARVSRALAAGTSERALKQAARRGYTSVFAPAGEYSQYPERRGEYSETARYECVERAVRLQHQGYDAETKIIPRSKLEAMWKSAQTGLNIVDVDLSGGIDDSGFSSNYEPDDWIGVEVKF